MKLNELYETVTAAPQFSFEQLPDRTIACVDSNTYDGALDSKHQQMGYGSNRQEAVADLSDHLLDDKVYPEDVLRQAEQDYITAERGDDVRDASGL